MISFQGGSVSGLTGFLAVVLVFIWIYNKLIHVRNEVENAVGAVHSILQKRADVIPSLVATLNQYSDYESGLLKELTEARTLALRSGSTSVDALQSADQTLSGLFGKVMAVAENYPDLKANQNFLGLQASLNEVEGQLAAARRTYNAAVVRYNTVIESIPTVILASMLGYKRKPVFQVTEAVAQKPDLNQLFGRKTG